MRITGVVGQRPDTLLMLLREKGMEGGKREGGGKERGRREGGGGREGERGEGRGEEGRGRVHHINTQHPVPRTPWCTW